jgi:hypothetical protein
MEELLNHHIQSQTPDYAQLFFIREQEKRDQFYEQITEQQKAEFINDWIIDPAYRIVEQYLLDKDRYRLIEKTDSGILKSYAVKGFEIPIPALFDEDDNLKTLRKIMKE